MSATAGQGSGRKADDWFIAISKQLAAMDERLRSMEAMLHNVDMIQAKVFALEESTGELGAQQETLAMLRRTGAESSGSIPFSRCLVRERADPEEQSGS
jgi:hypothetical protein